MMDKLALLIGCLIATGGFIGMVHIKELSIQQTQTLNTSEFPSHSAEHIFNPVIFPILIGDTSALIERSQSFRADQPTGLLLAQLASSFLGRPYKASSLDQTNDEWLRLDLTSFDCFLFVEQLLALSQTKTAADFINRVRLLRYQNGNVDYCSRYHYFTHWAQNGVTRGWIQDLTPSLDKGASRMIQLDFMSNHQNKYIPMKQKRNIDCIRSQESGSLTRQNYLPLTSLSKNLNMLRTGDIFALTTRIRGLDVTHTGLIEITPEGVNAIHAAPRVGVIRSRDFLRYVSSIEDVVGVSLYRPLTVR